MSGWHLGTLADRVRHAMVYRGVGYNQLDRAMKRSEGYTSRMLSENRMPRADTLRTLCRTLQVSMCWLIEGEACDIHIARERKATSLGAPALIELNKRWGKAR